MNFSPNNSGNNVKPGTRISLSSIPPPQNTQFDLIIRDLVKYFFTHPQGEVMVFIYKLQKLGHEEDLCLEEEPNNFLLQLMVNLALVYHLQYFAFSQLSGSAKHHIWILPLPFAGHLFQPSFTLHQCYPGVPA